MSENRSLKKNLSPLSVWAYAIGTSVSWGSLVVTCNTYLAKASGVDFDNRHKILEKFHNLSLEHIKTGEVAVSVGYNDYDREKDEDAHAVFIRADELMYKEKQFLNSQGSISR